MSTSPCCWHSTLLVAVEVLLPSCDAVSGEKSGSSNICNYKQWRRDTLRKNTVCSIHTYDCRIRTNRLHIHIVPSKFQILILLYFWVPEPKVFFCMSNEDTYDKSHGDINWSLISLFVSFMQVLQVCLSSNYPFMTASPSSHTSGNKNNYICATC